MLNFLLGYLVGSVASEPSRSLTDSELIGFGVVFVLLLVVGLPALIRFTKRGL